MCVCVWGGGGGFPENPFTVESQKVLLSMFLLSFMQKNGRFIITCVFLSNQPIAMVSVNHCVKTRMGNYTKSLLLVN